MTTQEKIDVMQAYLDGKPIQIRNRAVVSEWTDLEVKEPSWDWNTYVYRVKPGSKLRPYKNAEEFLQAQKEHGQYLKTIEQRAAIIAVEVIANMVQVIDHHDAETLQGIKNYIARELEKQRKLDIEKACEWLKRELAEPMPDEVYKEWCNEKITDFRKYMEE